MKIKVWIIFSIFLSIFVFYQEGTSAEMTKGRECYLMDFSWRFAFGHPYNAKKDFGHGTGYFSYFAKTGYGDGPASLDFDDRAWRIINLPHDWAVELPFNNKGGHSHGYRAIGRDFPENSTGWYRKKFFISESDLGRRIIIEFDGIHRNSMLWINGFYIGEEHSGYSSFQYDITDYLNYGGENIIAVRVDVTMEEGWYYEGAGIYRHVRLSKIPPLHIAQFGTFVTSELKDKSAIITVKTKINNETPKQATFDVIQTIKDAKGKQVGTAETKKLILKDAETNEYNCIIKIENPNLWSVESPYLYKLFTSLRSKDQITDTYKTTFGIRSVRFDPNKGFFLNSKHVKLKGTNNHQDHAGVGTAIPDALQEFRIAKLKSMGCNAYRCSHNPPTPELLDACDKLGMLVLDENRLMGSSPEHFQQLERLILRDRNHPCVIVWSLGNEEWAIEGNVKGARIVSSMQSFVRRLDPSRRITAASSGGWGYGISKVVDVMGYNYIVHGNIDEHHKKFPNQPSIGTEETTGSGTRGIYEDNRAKGHLAPMYIKPDGASIETGLKFYDSRPFVAGLFYWTGFDYRGEANPCGWPQVNAQYGIVDLCGFPKDEFYYLKSWWTDKPVLHLLPHWNWKVKEGQPINIRAYSNCSEIELFLNGKSLGRKPMQKLSHIEWTVPYKPGTLLARGYKNGKEVITRSVQTTGDPAVINLIPDRTTVKADREDVSIITVQIEDNNGLVVPTACNEISFSIKGPGEISGVGNGDPSSHEPDQFLDIIKNKEIKGLKMAFTVNKREFPEVAYDFDDSKWEAFKQTDEVNKPRNDTLIIIRGSFQLPVITDDKRITLFTKSICENQSVYVNGHLIAKNIKRNAHNQEFKLDHNILKKEKNIFAITGTPFIKTHKWEELNMDPGLVQVFIPAGTWKRKAFNGLAQIIVQSYQQPGDITLTAKSPSLKPAVITVKTKAVKLRPEVPAKK